jgi:hypothetical protein
MASRGLAVSKKQCCDILGWTSSEFDKAVREGMPVAERPSGRGTDFVLSMGDVVRWIVSVVSWPKIPLRRRLRSSRSTLMANR